MKLKAPEHDVRWDESLGRLRDERAAVRQDEEGELHRAVPRVSLRGVAQVEVEGVLPPVHHAKDVRESVVVVPP